MLLDDFFIDRQVDSSMVQRLVQYAEDNNLDCLRISPNPPPGRIIEKKLKIGILSPRAPYFVSTQPAIWKVETLQKMMHKGYSAWDFEIKNSLDNRNYNYRFMGTSKYYIHHHNGVERGRYYKSTLHLLKREGIEIEDKNRRDIVNDCTLKYLITRQVYKLKEMVKVKAVMFQEK